jgi:hypothetical protein
MASLLLWNLPFGGVLLYPFKLFATWLHELSHGLVMLAVGAGFAEMHMFQDTSGFAFSARGTGGLGQAAVASAGYMGTALFGAAFLVLGRTRRGARAILAILGAALLLSAILYVRNRFGVIAVLVGAVGTLAAAAFASEQIARHLLNFVAAQSCINAVLDIRTLFRANLVVDGAVVDRSDAHNMAEATFGTHWMWATIWLCWSFALFYAALRIVYLRETPADATRQATSSR